MADAQEPPKDKVKKKKSSMKKTDASKEKSEVPKEKPEPPKETPVVSNEPEEVPADKPKSRKQSAVVPESQPDESSAAPASRKSSTVLPESQNNLPEEPEPAAPAPAPVPENEADDVQKTETPKRRQSENVPRPAPRKERRPENFREEMDEEKLTELKEAFELFDINGDGVIDLPDLKLTFASLGRPEISDEDLTTMLAEAKNPMDFDSFVMLLGYKTIAMDPEETLLKALSAWDYRDSGLISQERIKHDLMTWGDKFDRAEAEGALEDAPTFITNGQPMIDYIKFCRTLGGLRKADTTADDD